jgi:hypothetical protein
MFFATATKTAGAHGKFKNPNGFDFGTGTTPAGRAILPLHGSARVIFCNPAHGSASDANAGTDPTLPMLTPNAAWSKLRDGFGDWLLFPQGTTISKGFGILTTRNGLSLTYPILVSTYDAADALNTAKYRLGHVTFDVPANEYPFYGGFSSNRQRMLVVENVWFLRSATPADDGAINSFLPTGNGAAYAYQMWSHCRFGEGGSGSGGGSHFIFRHCVIDHAYAYGNTHGIGMYLAGWAAALSFTYVNNTVAFRLIAGATPYVAGDKFTFTITAGAAGAVSFAGTGNGTLTGVVVNPVQVPVNQTIEVEALSAIRFKVTSSVSGISDTYAENVTTLTNGMTTHNLIEDCVGYHCGYTGDRDEVTAPEQTVTGVAASSTPATLAFSTFDFTGRAANATWHDPNDANTPWTGASGYLVAWVSTGYVSTDRLDVVNEGTGAGQIGRSGNDVTYAGAVIGTVNTTYDGDGNANFRVDFMKSGTDLRANLTDAAIQALVQKIRYWSTAGTPSGTRTIKVLVMEADHGKIPNIFKHNFYFATYTYNTVFRRNVSAHSGSHGLQARGGGTITDNLFLSNPIALLIGGGDNYNVYRPSGVPHTVSRNTIVGAEDGRLVSPFDLLSRGRAIEMVNTASGGHISGNITLNISAASTGNQYAVLPDAQFNIPTVVNYHDNKIQDWASVSFASATAGASFPAQVSTTTANNIWTSEAASGSNIQPGSLAVAYRDATRTESSLATFLGYGSVDAMWDDVVTKPEVPWCERMKPYFDYGMNAC